MRQPSPGPTIVHDTTQNSQTTNHLPPIISQSTPASINSISPQSRSELDTNHGDMIDETIKHVTQTHNQILMTSNQHSTNTLTQKRPHDAPATTIPLTYNQPKMQNCIPYTILQEQNQIRLKQKHLCYARQCLLICTILLELSRCIPSYILYIYFGHYDTQHSSSGSLVFTHLGSIQKE